MDLTTHTTSSPSTLLADGPPIPMPFTTFSPQGSSSLTPLVCDKDRIPTLLKTILHKGGLSIAEAARRMGCRDSVLSQYINGRRQAPSLFWFVKFAELCGSRVILEYPQRMASPKKDEWMAKYRV